MRTLTICLTLFFISLVVADDPYKEFMEVYDKDYRVEVDIVKNVDAKLKAVRALLKLKEERAIQTASVLFKDEHERVREVTYREMEEAIDGNSDLKEFVATKLVRDRNPLVQAFVMRLIGNLKIESGLDDVRKASKSGRDEAKEEALLALMKMGNADDADLAKKALRDRNDNVRAAAVYAMVYLDYKKHSKKKTKSSKIPASK